MNRGHIVSRAAILLARHVGGPEREDWVRAMAAEWDELETGKTRWALGCLRAALSDRVRRGWRFPVVIAGAYFAVAVCNTLVMKSAVSVMRQFHSGPEVLMAVSLVNPVIVPLVLGAIFPRRSTALGLVTGLLFVLNPMIGLFMTSGMGPVQWMTRVLSDIGPFVLLYPLSVAIWVAAARIGASVRRRFRTA